MVAYGCSLLFNIVDRFGELIFAHFILSAPLYLPDTVSTFKVGIYPMSPVLTSRSSRVSISL